MFRLTRFTILALTSLRHLRYGPTLTRWEYSPLMGQSRVFTVFWLAKIQAHKPPTFEIRANIDSLALEIESLVSPQKTETLHTLERNVATLKTATRCFYYSPSLVLFEQVWRLKFLDPLPSLLWPPPPARCPTKAQAHKTDATSAIKCSRTETASTDTWLFTRKSTSVQHVTKVSTPIPSWGDTRRLAKGVKWSWGIKAAQCSVTFVILGQRQKIICKNT